MKERLKEIRKSKKLSQAEFAEMLNISRGHLAGLESGAKNITDRLVNDICRVFNVNTSWFIDGEGEMFNDPLDGLGIDDELKDMINMYKQLDDNTRKIVKKFMCSAIKDFE